MQYIQLGNSGLRVSKLCLGTGTIARAENENRPPFETVALIQQVLDSGCNYIDTAASYRSENIVGQAVKSRRDSVIIADKIGHVEPSEAAAKLEASLRALDTDYIDLYLLRWPSPTRSIVPLLEELARQREAGKIRNIGLSNANLEHFQDASGFDLINSQSPFSILWRTPQAIVDHCRQSNISITAYSPLAQGLLTGRFSRQKEELSGWKSYNTLVAPENLPASLKVASLLDTTADKLSCTPAQAALAWVLQTSGIDTVAVQVSKFSQWQDNLKALELDLPTEDYETLNSAGLAVWNHFGPDANLWNLKIE